jgi:hypothetical protein
VIDFDALVLAPAMAAFGQDVTWYPAQAAPVQLTGPMAGVFDDRYVERKFQDGVEVVETKPVLNARTVAFPPAQPAQYDVFGIGGILYAATAVEPDGFGNVKISLRLASDAEAAKVLRP